MVLILTFEVLIFASFISREKNIIAQFICTLFLQWLCPQHLQLEYRKHWTIEKR